MPYSFDVGYDYWTAEQILYSVMPEGDAETPSSYTTTGHIGKIFEKKKYTHIELCAYFPIHSACKFERRKPTLQTAHCPGHSRQKQKD